MPATAAIAKPSSTSLRVTQAFELSSERSSQRDLAMSLGAGTRKSSMLRAFEIQSQRAASSQAPSRTRITTIGARYFRAAVIRPPPRGCGARAP